ncbi:DUF2232 domain-containing protein [Paenibacillus marinisediminis]
MNKRWLSIAWAIAAVVLLLSIGNPIQLITMSFMAIPFVMLFTTQSIRSFVIHVVALLIVVFFLAGTFGSVVVLASIYFIIPGIVMGYMFKRNRSGWNAFTAGTITFLAESLVLLAIGTFVFDLDIVEFIRSQVQLSMDILQQAGGITPDKAGKMVDALVIMLNKMIPVMLIMSSIYMGAITYAISNRLLTAQGVHVNKMKPIKHWMLPKSFIWYYLITIIMQIFVGDSPDSFLLVILLNLMPLLHLGFIIQGISFLFYFADFKRWPKIIPVAILITSLIIPFAYILLRIVGIIDMAFPLRQMVSRPKQ